MNQRKGAPVERAENIAYVNTLNQAIWTLLEYIEQTQNANSQTPGIEDPTLLALPADIGNIERAYDYQREHSKFTAELSPFDIQVFAKSLTVLYRRSHSSLQDEVMSLDDGLAIQHHYDQVLLLPIEQGDDLSVPLRYKDIVQILRSEKRRLDD